jgi:WD40 repeat protein
MWDLENPSASPAALGRSDKIVANFFVSLSFTPDGRRGYGLPMNGGRAILWKLDAVGSVIDPIQPPDSEIPDEGKGETGQNPKDAQGQVARLLITPLVLSSRDGRWLIDAGRGGRVRLWDLIRPDPFGNPALQFDSRASLPSLNTIRSPSSPPFTADSRWLETTDGNNLYIWDLGGNEPRHKITIPLESGDPVRGVAVDPTGQWVALVGSDNQLHIWEVTTEGCVERTIVQPAPQSSLWSHFFLSPGGKRVVDIDFASVPFAQIYRVPLDQLKEAAQQAVGRNLTRDEWKRFFPGQDYRKTFEVLPEPPP